MFIISDRIKETSSTTGSGSVVFDGAYGAFQTFSVGIGNGNTTYYTIENNSRWEVGQGTYYSATNSLSRDVVFDSSEGGSKITLEGTSIVFCTLPASKAFLKDPNYSVAVNNIFASGDANIDSIFSQSINNSGNLNIGEDALVSGNLNVLGNLNYDGSLVIDNVTATGDIISSGFLTLTRQGEGNFFHAFKDDGTRQTVSLHVDDNVSPLWKLGLKTNPNDPTADPTFAYVYGRDGLVGLVSNDSNFIYLSDSLGFTVVNDSHLIFRANSATGVTIDAKSTTGPAFTIQGSPLTIADLQVWEDSTGSTLSVVDSGGKFGILNDSPLYQLDVNGSGKMKTITVTSGVYFQDGTFQSSAFTGTDASAVSGWAAQTITNGDNAVSGWAASTFLTSDDDSIANFASGLAVQNETDIATVSGLLYDDTAVSGYFETRVDTADSQISSVSGWAASTFLTSDDDSIANFASGLAVQNEIETLSVSGYFETRSDTNAADIVTVSGLLGGNRTYNNITEDFSMSDDSDVVFMDTSSGPINVHLPTASGQGGKEIMVKYKAGSNSGVLIGSGSQTIDGQSQFGVYNIYESISLISDNSNWFIS